MKTARFISLMLFAALFTFFSSCSKEDLSMESDISLQEMAKASPSQSGIRPILDSAINVYPTDPIDFEIWTPIRQIEGYTNVESQLVAMSWKNLPGLPIIIQTEEDYLKVFKGPVSIDLDMYTIIATSFIHNVGAAQFVSSFYFKNDEPAKCRWHLDNIFRGTTTQVETIMSVAIIIPKMKVTDVEVIGVGRPYATY